MITKKTTSNTKQGLARRSVKPTKTATKNTGKIIYANSIDWQKTTAPKEFKKLVKSIEGKSAECQFEAIMQVLRQSIQQNTVTVYATNGNLLRLEIPVSEKHPKTGQIIKSRLVLTQEFIK
jgi:protein-disulfide isomerase